MDFPFNPFAEFPHGNGFGFLVFQKGCRRAVLVESIRRGRVAGRRLEPRDFKRMRDGEFAHVECLLHFLDKVRQTQACIDVFLGAPDFLGKRFDGVGVGLQLHQGRIAPRLIEFVHVGALQVFDELQFEAFRVGEFANACGNGFPLGEFRSAVSPRSGHEFKGTRLAVRQRTDENGLQDAMLPDVVRKFRQLVSSNVRLGLVFDS